MTMLTHTRGPFERAPYSSQGETRSELVRRSAPGDDQAILRDRPYDPAAGSAVAAIMALKIAIYLPLFIHH